MAYSTGPDINTYSIPYVELGDNFNYWRDVTNTAVYKLNKLRFYEGVSSGSISVTTGNGGTASIALLETIDSGHTFMGNINFGGIVTFNSATVTMNANTVTIDDYYLVLGDTAGASDTNIGSVGGGGIILNRTSGASAEWLWQPTGVHGVTGVWRSNTHIGFSGSTSGIYPADGGVLPVHGLGIRVDGGSTSDHGFAVTLTNTGVAGATSNRTIQFSRYAPTGSTAFMEVLNGTTYGSYPFVNIVSGVNRKRVTQTAHGLSFGTPVYLKADGKYYPASCNDVDQAETIGLVSALVDSNNFELTYIGEIYGNFSNALLSGSSLVSGTVYYLTNSVGKLSTVPSRAAGTVHKAVMIGTGSNSGVVIPFTGGLLSDDLIITTASTVGKTVLQLNKFRVGDALRWIPGATGLSYAYAGGGGTYTNSTYYTEGIFVKAQANSEAEAEVIGLVSEVFPIVDGANTGNTPVNFKFTLTTNGYFSGIGGVCADSGSMSPGVQYFLAANCAGNSASFESSAASIVSSPPTTIGYVRKPLLFSGSTTSGYIIPYRGDVNNAGQSSFTGYTGSVANYSDLPVGSMVMGVTGSTLSPNTGVTLYYHNSGGLSGEYGIYTGSSPSGITMLGLWRTRGRALDRGTSGVTAYHLCQRIL